MLEQDLINAYFRAWNEHDSANLKGLFAGGATYEVSHDADRCPSLESGSGDGWDREIHPGFSFGN